MKINGLEINVEDCNQRFSGTFMKVSINDGTPEVVYVHKFLGDIVTLLTGPRQENQVDVKTKTFRIIQEFPAMGAVNHQGDVHFLTRKALRQWQRGLSAALVKDNCRTSPSGKNFGMRLGMEEAMSCFDRRYVIPEDGIPLLKTSTIRSFAFNEHYWYSGKKKTYLWRDSTCLGEILGNKLFAFPAACIMRDELNEELGGRYEVQ